jgi:5'-AMP-activated protein kinase, regulatory gamma subunit
MTNNDKFLITSEAQRNSLFRNNPNSNDECGYVPKSRFDNTSFIRSLESSISNGSVDSGHNTGGSSSSNNSKEKLSKNNHHHSIQEMIKHFSKKVHLWSRSRHDSINENEISNDRRTSTPEPAYVPPENFRSRSKSLDVTMSRSILDDCESTYKIYNKILKEGK